MSKNYYKKAENPGRILSRRIITVMLSFMMIFTMMPWIAPDQGQASAATPTLLWPARDNNGNADKNVNWNYGWHVVNGQRVFHNGIDISTAKKWYAAYSGTVDAVFTGCVASQAANNPSRHNSCNPYENGKKGSKHSVPGWPGTHCNHGYGNGVRIRTDSINGVTYYMQYAHMKTVSPNIKAGMRIKKGTYLGEVGGTGCSTGVHAHFQVCKNSTWDNSMNTNIGGAFTYDYSKPDKVVTESPSVQEDRNYKEWSIGTTNAVPCAVIYNPNIDQISTVGIKVKEGNTVIASKSEGVPSNHSRLQTIHAWFNINKECNAVLKPGTTYTYMIFAYVGGKEYNTGWKTFKTNGDPTPNNLSFSTPKRDYAAGDSAIVSWGADSKAAKGYSVTIKQTSGGNYTDTKEITSYKSNQAAFELPSVGEYQISGYAKGSSKNSAVTTMSRTIVAHGPSTVRFVETDDNGENENLLSQQTVKYGYAATAPTNVTRKGHTFTGWNKSFSSVTTDLTVTAQFKRNKYKIVFYDKDDNVLSTETVEYEGSVEPPEAPAPEAGYVFLGWDSDAYRNVQGNASIHASYAWANDELPVLVTVNSCEFKDDGYVINYNVKNNPDIKTKGRALVSLHTANNKLLASTESSAFSLAKGQEKTDQEIFVPYEGAASKASIYIVNEFGSGIPISNCLTSDVVRNWSNWTTEVPAEGDISESRTEYRKKDKILTTTRTATNDGWTLYDTVIDPSWTFGSWSGWSKTKYTASESTYAKREVQTKSVSDNNAYTKYNWYYYRYWNSSAGTYYYTYSANMGGTKYTWTTTSMLNYYGTFDGHKGYTTPGGKNFSGEVWFLESQQNVAATSHTEYRYRDGTKGTTYYWYKWGDWSDWTPEVQTETSSREVETRKTYRVMDALGEEDTTGDTHTISGTLDPALAGKQALIQVYKNDEPSDSNNEYVGQTTIGDNGEYSFTFTTREKISRKTGDFTVVLGVEGSEKQVFIKTIEAPKPVYTVNFKDDEGNIIDTQQVTEGKSATSPEVPNKEHYVFVGWDYGITNIRDDMDVTAQYIPEKYAVAFVNWDTQEASAEVFSYGDAIDYPDATEIEGYEFTGWTTPEGDTVENVTGNMVLQANYKVLSYNVKFYDAEGKALDEQTIVYDQAAEAPEPPEVPNMVFKDWSTYEFNSVKGDLDVYAVYEYVESTGTPSCDTPSGTFKYATDIHLSADADATIYYTVDGSIPTTNSAVYTDKITVDKNMYLQYIAIAPNKNPSTIQSASYLVSSGEDDEGALVVKSEEYTLEKGEEVKVTYSLWGSDAEVGFFSLDDQIATVDEEGVVHANKKGQTKIFVRTVDNSYADYCDIIVNNSSVEVSDIDLNAVYIPGVPGDTIKLNPTITPDDAANKELDWFVEDESVASVSPEGELKFLSRGRTTLSVYSKDGAAANAVIIEGVKSEPDAIVGIFPYENQLNALGEQSQYTVLDNGVEQSATWAIADEKVATIDAAGNATATGYGTTKIIATTADGTEYEALLTVTRNVTADSVKAAIAALPAEITLDNEAEVAQIREDYEALEAEAKAEITAEELAKLEAAEAKIAELKEADPAEALEQAIADKEKAEAEAKAAEQRAVEAEQAAAQAQSEAAAAQTEAAAAQAELAQAQKDLAALQASADATEAELTQAQKDLAALQASADATEAELAEAEANIAELEKAAAEAAEKLTKAQTDLEQAQQTAAEATQRAAEAESAAAEAEHKLAKAEQDAQTANAELAKITQEKEAAEQAAEAAEQRATAAEQRAAEAEARATAAEKALADLENGEDLQAAEARAIAAEAAAAEAKARAEEAEARAAAAEKALEELQSNKTDITELNLDLVKSVEWNGGKEICPYDSTISPKGDLEDLKINRDYNVTYENNADVGTATAVIKGRGDYFGTLTTTYEIVPCDLTYYDSDVRLKSTGYTYTGKDIKPAVIVDISYPATVTKDDYTVTYPEESSRIGSYTVEIKFKGNYSGTIEKTFKINPKATSMISVSPQSKGFTAKWRKQSTQTSGYQLQYSTSSTFKSGNKTVTISRNSTVSKKVTKLKARKRYYVRVRTYKTVSGKKYYSAWSAKKSVKTK